MFLRIPVEQPAVRHTASDAYPIGITADPVNRGEMGGKQATGERKSIKVTSSVIGRLNGREGETC